MWRGRRGRGGGGGGEEEREWEEVDEWRFCGGGGGRRGGEWRISRPLKGGGWEMNVAGFCGVFYFLLVFFLGGRVSGGGWLNCVDSA